MQANMSKTYDIFLSYNHRDQDWVRELASRIESERYGDRKLKVYLDTWDMVPGHDMIKSMEEGLQQSRYVAPIISKHSIDAEWPNMEWSIAISFDPSGRKGTVIPIWLGDCEIPPSLKTRLVLYCQNTLLFEKSYSRLISILTNQNLPRSSENTTKNTPYLEQFPLHYEDDVEEQLPSNLFPVVSLPKTIWSGPTNFSNVEVFRLLDKYIVGTLPTFIIKNKKIFSFWDLNDRQCPFRKVLNADVIESESIYDWMKTDDQSRWLIELLNKGLKNYCNKLWMRFDAKHKRYYFTPHNGQDRTIQWDTGKRKATRTVVKRYIHKKSKEIFWSHQTLQAKFTIINNDIFLQLIPGWYFTKDGVEPLPTDQSKVLSIKWTTKEHNASVFSHIRFWSNYLSRESMIKIPLGGTVCEVDTIPAVIELNKGLEGDRNLNKMVEIADSEIQVTEMLREVLLEESQLDIVEIMQGNDNE